MATRRGVVRVIGGILKGCAYVQLRGGCISAAEDSVDGLGDSIWESGWRGVWVDVEKTVYESSIRKGYQE